MTIVLLIIAVLFLAYWNGANDNFKGVATLYGSGTVNYRTAISLATAATFAGSLASIFLAQGLISAFSGKGLVPDQTAGGLNFLISVGLGASFTVLLATRLGLPISTTHSLVGGLTGAGLLAAGSQINLGQLGTVFVVPLLVSPFLACTLALALYILAVRLRQTAGIEKELCLCVGAEREPVTALRSTLISSFDATSLPGNTHNIQVTVADNETCQQLYTSRVVGIQLQTLLDAAHIGSGTLVSFARGLNDTPKIAGLLVAASSLNMTHGLLAISFAVAIGGIINARRVAETISHEITQLSHGQGLVSNLVTGFLVTVASRFGIPVSTTHVSVGSIIGIGITSGTRDLSVIRDILLSWVATLPTAMCLSGMFYWLLGAVFNS